MIIHKEFIDQIILRRDASLSELVVGKECLNLKNGIKDVGDLIDPLDRIFYTIEFLQNESLIECEKRGYSISDGLFDLPFSEEVNKVYPTMYLHDLWKDAAGWKIKIKPGLVHFKEQGYQTDNQLKEKKQFWLTIGVALGASALTAILTTLLTRAPVISCWSF